MWQAHVSYFQHEASALVDVGLCQLVDDTNGLTINGVLCTLGCHLVGLQRVINCAGHRLGLSVLLFGCF